MVCVVQVGLQNNTDLRSKESESVEAGMVPRDVKGLHLRDLGNLGMEPWLHGKLESSAQWIIQ